MLRLLDELPAPDAVAQACRSLRFAEASLSELLSDVLALHRPLAERQKLEPTLELGPNLPAVSIDADRIFQVVANLLVNALSVTPAGGRVTVSACFGYDEVVVAVSDTGPGMTEANKERAFEPFFRGSAAYPGSGLGLAVARDIVDQHGGRIWVQTAPGRGATFAFAVPLEPRRGPSLEVGGERV
jgi:signal transduction histidine kinase